MEANWINGPPTKAGYYWAWSKDGVDLISVWGVPGTTLYCLTFGDDHGWPLDWIFKHMKIESPPAP